MIFNKSPLHMLNGDYSMTSDQKVEVGIQFRVHTSPYLDSADYFGFKLIK